MGAGGEVAQTKVGGRDTVESETETVPGTAPSTGTLALRALLSNGIPDVPAVAEVIAAHPNEHPPMFSLLQTTVGNGYVQSVLGMLGAAPIQLNPNAPPPAPRSPLPLANEADLKARADRLTAEGLLKSKDLNAGDQATKAMEILIDIPAAERGKMIDALDDKAFANLLDRVPDDQRERFEALIDGSQNPKRKLKLWAEFHKSRAENDLSRHRGDVGQDVPKHPTVDDEGNAVEEEDDEEKARIEATWTPEQKANRVRDKRRTEAVDSTKGEVDVETARLMKKADTGSLTVADVDAMRERKDLEYKIELENNVSLTTYQGPGFNGTDVVWTADDLRAIELTLSRLPHDSNGFKEIHRVPTLSVADGKGGELQGQTIEITDNAASRTPGFSHGGSDRELVSEAFKREHGDKVATLEFVLTHEIGHDINRQHPEVYKKFLKAAGWEQVDAKAVRADHVSDADMAQLEKNRENPNAAGSTIGGDNRTYAPIHGGNQYWAVDRTAIPAADEAAPGSTGGDTWEYSRVDPDEHFAETYAKAVHVPEKLHDELVDRPAAAAQEVHARIDALKVEIADLPATPSAAAKRETLNARLAVFEADAATKDKAKKQRADEFAVMRNDVFGTEKAVVVAKQRLVAKHVAPDKIAEFEKRAERASTPEQVGVMEAEVTQ